MMKFKLIIQPSALADLDEAYLWIARRSPENAARWFNRFVEALQTLVLFPNRCIVAPESEQIGREIRQLLYGRRGGRYRALFVVHGREVHVLHIRHAARTTMKPEEW
ncbi:MAG: type II toxin-antitoxin system RelE/ParE family toxin [Pirellulales bacterium]|nr:type II toxin-antitoxin system RelE/ParE family toxin [Pirellulales bacterium]